MTTGVNATRQTRIIKGFARLMSGTMFSRVTGMIREMAMAFFLGSGAAMDAFVVAFTLPNLFRRILGEKVLESAMMPSYKQLLNSGKHDLAGNLLKTSLFLLISIGSFITALGMVFSPWLVTLFAPGFDPETHRLAVFMTRIMFPFLVIISVASMFGVILQTREKFGIYGFAPAVFNIAVIIVLWVGMTRFGPPVAAVGVLIGGILEALIMLPIVRETFHFCSSRITVLDPSVKRVNKLALPVIVETVMDKAIVLVDRRLASVVSEGSIAALGYSFRLLQLPYGLLVLGIARTYYQHLVDAADDLMDFAGMIAGAMRFTLALMAPCTAMLVVFGELAVRLVYQRGAFDEEAVALTSSAFIYYSVGIVGMTALAILSRAFNALKDTVTPVKVSVLMMVINIVLNYILVKTPLRHAGLAMASSIAYSFAGLALLILMQKRLSRLKKQAIRFHLVIPFIKICGASTVAAIAGFWAVRPVGDTPGFLRSLAFLSIGSGLFIIVYISMMSLLGLPLKKLLTSEQAV